MEVEHVFLRSSRKFFLYYQNLGLRALEQMPAETFHHCPPDSNSLAVIVKHMAGNMRSRWSNLFGGDGETASRDRDSEFVQDSRSKPEVLEEWEAGWKVFFTAFDALGPEDVLRSITIRGEELTVLEAVQRQLAHYAHHVGQIVYLVKAVIGADWKSLSVPKGESAAFNQAMFERNEPQP
jgi:uncharacterized damage-inducible protein DinB